MVRKANVAIDAGQLGKDDAVALLAALEQFDELFAVLKDDDAPKIKDHCGVGQGGRPRRTKSAKSCSKSISSRQLSDADVQKKIADIESARRSRDFKTSDSIRAELTAAGIAVEITKDGVRWKRK